MAQHSCSRQNNLTTSGFGKVAISVRHNYLDQVCRWRNWSCTTHWSHHSIIRHNMHLLCPQCLLPPRQTGRCVHPVIEVFALLQFCDATILQTCYAATVLQHIVKQCMYCSNLLYGFNMLEYSPNTILLQRNMWCMHLCATLEVAAKFAEGSVKSEWWQLACSASIRLMEFHTECNTHTHSSWS